MSGPGTSAADFGARIVYELPLASVRGRIQKVDISPLVTDGCIRLIDCVAFTADHILRIWEFPESPLQEFKGFLDWPKLKYSAISYVWKGNPVDPCSLDANDRAGYLVVKGAEEGDPISIEVLRSACVASLRDDEPGRWRMISRAGYIWLDRLCIVQTSKRDKNMQIAQMYRIYKCSTQCLVLAGGLRRLVSLDDETTWANRAWTLQECLAPQYPMVLFAWSMGEGRFIGTSAFKLREVGEGTGCALARFIDLVRACIDIPMVFNACPIESPLSKWNKPSIIAAGTPVNIKIFGKGHADLFALRQARLNFQNSSDPFEPSSTRRCYAMIWRCALMRTSSRPVDMVLSIMALMGVALDPKEFDANDRLGATIALISKIMNQGGSADWLGMPARIPPCPQLSTFPQFAKTDVAGDARYLVSGKWCAGRSLDDWHFAGSSWDWDGKGDIWTWERLYGSIDEKGYLLFTRKACVLSAAITEFPSGHKFEWPLLAAMDGTVWQFHEDLNLNSQPFPKIAAIPLWRFMEYLKVSEFEMADQSAAIRAIKFMLVKEHGDGSFNVLSYFYVDDEDEKTWKLRVEEWKEYGFAVGGPEPLLNQRKVSPRRALPEQ